MKGRDQKIFLEALDELEKEKGILKEELLETIETALLHEELDIPYCCDIINKQWQSSGYQLALIDTDSSDYTITVIQKP